MRQELTSATVEESRDGRERRCYESSVELRTDGEGDDKKNTIRGYAAVFGQETVIGDWFREVIDPGAFTESVRADDVRALFNHDPNIVLGRTKNRTLTLSEDSQGLFYEAKPPDTTSARDVVTLVDRGDVSQSSFAFSVLEQSWEYSKTAELPLRRIRKAKLYDVSPVTYPAYPTTTVSARTAAEAHRAAPPPPSPPAAPSDEAWRQQIAQARARVDLELADDAA